MDLDRFRPAPGSTLLFEGDSLTAFRVGPHLDTWAWSRMTGATYGYPERVGDWLFCQRPELAVSVRCGAIAGSNASDLLERFDRLVAPVKPQLVVMTIGTNDAAQLIEPETVADRVGEFCQRLERLSQGRVLHLGGSWPEGVGPAQDPGLRERRFATARAIAARLSLHGGASVDLCAVLARRQAILRKLYEGHTIFHDGTHFNAVGHEIVAGVVLRALGLMHVPGEPPLAMVAS